MYLEHKKGLLLGIFIECPTGAPDRQCPAREIRKLSIDDRMQIVEGIGPEVVERLLKQHQMCLLARESDRDILFHRKSC